MKKLSYLLVIFLLCFLSAGSSKITEFRSAAPRITDCQFNGIPLHGKVKIVDHFPDFKVRVVDHFPDLKVKVVKNFPDDCGEWQFVESFPDFTIQLVSSFEDFSIKYVDSFPGMP